MWRQCRHAIGAVELQRFRDHTIGVGDVIEGVRRVALEVSRSEHTVQSKPEISTLHGTGREGSRFTSASILVVSRIHERATASAIHGRRVAAQGLVSTTAKKRGDTSFNTPVSMVVVPVAGMFS